MSKLIAIVIIVLPLFGCVDYSGGENEPVESAYNSDKQADDMNVDAAAIVEPVPEPTTEEARLANIAISQSSAAAPVIGETLEAFIVQGNPALYLEQNTNSEVLTNLWPGCTLKIEQSSIRSSPTLVHVESLCVGWGRPVYKAMRGWVPTKNTLSLSDFKQLSSWTGEVEKEVVAGDWILNYKFHRNGTYSVNGELKGHLRQGGSVIVGQDTNDDVFTVDQDGKLCHIDDFPCN